MERLTLLDIVKKLISSDEYEPDVQWCLSELRDILEIVGDMSGERLRELIEADRDGRCMVLQYTADAIAEKVVREAEKALEEMEA